MVETTMLRATGETDGAKRAAYIVKETATLNRWRAKGRAGARRYRDFAEMTDAQIAEQVEASACIYSSRFRVYERVAT